jgi:hypothetical protein
MVAVHYLDALHMTLPGKFNTTLPHKHTYGQSMRLWLLKVRATLADAIG